MFDVEVTVIGGGIVGCAAAAACAGAGRSTVLLEMEAGVARATTSRNSEVAHGGMYYPTGSLKARFCVEGRRLLKEFCTAAGVGYREFGKIIVAVEPAEIPALERLLALGQANGVEDLRLIDGRELADLEPQVKGVAGLLSPRTAVLDAEGAAKAYARLAAEHGAQIMPGTRVTGLERKNGAWQVDILPTGDKRREGWRHASRFVINAAGLWADKVAALAGIDIRDRGWQLHLSKGNYFGVDSAHQGKVSRLIYPVPPALGTSLGVHVCLDLAGRMKLGPDIQAPDADPRDVNRDPDAFALDYSVDPGRGDAFFEDARRFLPWLRREDLTPDMCGLRPKLVTAGFGDFVVQREEAAYDGLINLVGIESPGLTCAPALARHVAGLINEAD
jgi:L-2-hydroxyglutarate oxidase LhgO